MSELNFVIGGGKWQGSTTTRSHAGATKVAPATVRTAAIGSICLPDEILAHGPILHDVLLMSVLIELAMDARRPSPVMHQLLLWVLHTGLNVEDVPALQ
mmetsp:Transcript_70526/g.151088  ORF Transcript_70526/g.151088 Transcript_70526/m.151088 type:complete len:99 (+) Transcript_70526:112-408(+)